MGEGGRENRRKEKYGRERDWGLEVGSWGGTEKQRPPGETLKLLLVVYPAKTRSEQCFPLSLNRLALGPGLISLDDEPGILITAGEYPSSIPSLESMLDARRSQDSACSELWEGRGLRGI